MEFRGIIKERETWVKILAIVLAGYVLYREIMLGQYIYIPIVALIVLACFFRKAHIISEDGVDIQYELLGMKMHNWWEWEEITTIHTDRQSDRPNVRIHIGKDISTRTFVMKTSDIPQVLALAARQNPAIYIEDLTEEEREKREAEILHRQEVARAQKAARKKRKKS